MNHDDFRSPEHGDDDATHVGNLSLVELGEKLYQWRDYTTIPALMVLLLFANPGARSATIGTLFILLGTVARVYAVAFMDEETKDTVGAQYLVTSGPFALVRNPLYIGNLIITFGVIFYAGVIWIGLPLFIYFLFQYHCISKYEEHVMLAKFGDEYQRYMDRVPAWIPIKAPIADDFPIPPSIAVAIASEKKSLAAVGVILFLLMLAAH